MPSPTPSPETPAPETVPVVFDDGTMDLTVWRPVGDTVGSVLLLHEIFGVGDYMTAVAARLTALGVVVGAPDVFWRIHPGWAADHDEHGMRSSMGVSRHLDTERAIADCVAALDALDDADGVGGRPAVLGFCLGGTLAFGVAAAGSPSRCVSYYGSGVAGMLDRLERVGCPLLFHFGAADPYIASADVEAVAAAIAGRDDVMINIEQAGHAFDNEVAPMFYDETAARAAWTKTVAFLANGWAR